MSERWESVWYPDRAEGWLRRLALSPLDAAALLFRAGVRCRNAAYSRGWRKSARVEGASVLSVGNLNVGGTGKTPAVIYLANRCGAEGRRVAVLSRGYGRKSRECGRVRAVPGIGADIWGDEPLLIARRCPEAIVLAGEDRVELAKLARREFGCDLIILDDGMQYRRLRRDLEVVVIDEAVGFGNGKLLPRGPLREPGAALARADLVWIRAGPEPSFDSLRYPSVRTRYIPSAVFAPGGALQPPRVVRGRSVYAFAGVARPQRWLWTLRELSVDLVGSRFFPDHHAFTPAELDGLLREAKERNAQLLLTTEKDLMRLPRDFPAWTVRLEVEILEGAATLSQRLAVL